MERIRRFIHNNRNLIFKVVGITIVVLVAIQIFNQIAKNKQKESQTQTQATIDYGKDISAVTSEKKEERTYTGEKTQLEKFAYYCNQKDYEKAYDLLSEDCKQVLYPNIEIFKSNYCDEYFDSDKTVEFQLWSGSTYQAKIRNNVMSTGEYVDKKFTEDYITVDDEGKLNIDNFVRREKYTQTQINNSNIIVKIDNIEIFKEYSIVNISLMNKTRNTIKLDTLETDSNIYILDNKNVKYNVSVSEITQNQVSVIPSETKQIPLKFYIEEREDLDINKLKINKIIQNQELYEQSAENYKDYAKVEIEL